MRQARLRGAWGMETGGKGKKCCGGGSPNTPPYIAPATPSCSYHGGRGLCSMSQAHGHLDLHAQRPPFCSTLLAKSISGSETSTVTDAMVTWWGHGEGEGERVLGHGRRRCGEGLQARRLGGWFFFWPHHLHILPTLAPCSSVMGPQVLLASQVGQLRC